ncbi:hypothetical protein [Celerinatantimonas yamalensis]|uniref:Uncharacterized protein n=1 Tax=Celerinatantimonas yamalensis TaxID=559956 RepID=A0ABW9G350_9GAMM
MNEQTEKTQEIKRQSLTNVASQKQNSSAQTYSFVDNRPEAIQMQKLKKWVKNSPQTVQLRALQRIVGANSVAQKKVNVNKGLGIVDNQPEAIAQRKLQEIVINKTEANQLQGLDNNSLQLRRKKKNRPGGHKKTKAPALAVTRMYGDGTYAIANEANDTGLHLEHYETPQLFWRGDDRTYGQVRETGFNSKNERDNLSLEGSNVIKWRTGNNQDDIDPDSGVCVAADVRGAAFFPLDREAKYIYAVGLSSAINTYAIQKDVEKHDVGIGYERPERYPYDPIENLSEGQSAIWQYKEYVSHRILAQEILACYEIVRKDFLQDTGEKTLAGMRFKLSHIWTNSQLPKQFSSAIAKAAHVAEIYANWFPEKPTQYLSYYGIIETDLEGVKTAQDAQDAYERDEITVVDPLVGESAEDAYDIDISQERRKKQRTKNRRQKKRKKFRGRR